MQSAFDSHVRLIQLSPLLSILLLALSCGGPSTQEQMIEPYSEARAQLLKELRDEVITPALDTFQTETLAFKEKVASQDREAAQDAWKSMALAWQKLEMLQIGPAGASSDRVGGQDLRDHIYSFPLQSPCRVEQEWINQGYATPEWGIAAAFNLKGIDAAEHLLFQEGVASSCPEQIQIVVDGSWSRFMSDPQESEPARWGYLAVIAEDIHLRATALVDEWKGDFGRAFTEATTPFQNQREAIDQVFAGMYYFDRFVKDFKVGGPSGIYMTCLEDSCPEQLEHHLSGISRDALLSNIESLAAVLGEVSAARSKGFAALLVDVGAAELAEELIELARQAKVQVSALNDDLKAQLADDPEQMRMAHATISRLADLLESQFVTTLNLSVPQEGAGDND